MTSSKHTLNMLLLSMIFGAAMGACLTPYVLVTFLRDFQAGPKLISGFQVILQASMLVGPLVAILLSNYNAKSCTILSILAGRLPLIAIPILILLPRTHPVLPLATVLICGFYGVVCGAVSGPINTWFKQIIPAARRGRFLGQRNAVYFVTIAILTPLVGYALDHSDGSFIGQSTMYYIIFISAAFFGLLDLYFLTRSAGCDTSPRRSPIEVLQEVKKILRARRYWRTPLFIVLPTAGITLLAPYQVLILYDFEMSRFQVGMITALSTLGIAAGMLLGGNSADRQQGCIRRYYALVALLIAATHGGALVMLALKGAGVIGGLPLFWGILVLLSVQSALQGMNLAHFTRLIFDIVHDGSTIAFSFIGLIQNSLGFLIVYSSSGLGIILMNHTQRVRVQFWPWFHYAYVLFALAAGMGIAGAWLVRRLSEREENLADAFSLGSADGNVSLANPQAPPHDKLCA